MTFRAAGEKAVNYTNGIEYRGGDFESSKSIWDGFWRFIMMTLFRKGNQTNNDSLKCHVFSLSIRIYY